MTENVNPSEYLGFDPETKKRVGYKDSSDNTQPQITYRTLNDMRLINRWYWLWALDEQDFSLYSFMLSGISDGPKLEDARRKEVRNQYDNSGAILLSTRWGKKSIGLESLVWIIPNEEIEINQDINAYPSVNICRFLSVVNPPGETLLKVANSLLDPEVSDFGDNGFIRMVSDVAERKTIAIYGINTKDKITFKPRSSE